MIQYLLVLYLQQPYRINTVNNLKKKNEILPFGTTWISLEDIVLSDISQTERDKHCMFSLICGI